MRSRASGRLRGWRGHDAMERCRVRGIVVHAGLGRLVHGVVYARRPATTKLLMTSCFFSSFLKNYAHAHRMIGNDHIHLIWRLSWVVGRRDTGGRNEPGSRDLVEGARVIRGMRGEREGPSGEKKRGGGRRPRHRGAGCRHRVVSWHGNWRRPMSGTATSFGRGRVESLSRPLARTRPSSAARLTRVAVSWFLL